jgi:hypothetical protein
MIRCFVDSKPSANECVRVPTWIDGRHEQRVSEDIIERIPLGSDAGGSPRSDWD